jgi:NlpC/P60 family protein
MRPPPDYPASPYPLLAGGGLTSEAQRNLVVSLAAQYLGVPYVWAGESPKTGFDCSGLVRYVFGELGVSLPHYAAGQYYSAETVWVPPERLQPGDLVFFTGSDGTRKAPGHVGIYVGDGYLIDAPHTGSFVRLDSLDESWFANAYVGAKRVVAPLHARHLEHATKQAVSLPPLRLLGAQQMTEPAISESLRESADRPAARASAPRAYGLWTGGGVGAALLLLCCGGITYRRRERAPEDGPSTDSSN